MDFEAGPALGKEINGVDTCPVLDPDCDCDGEGLAVIDFVPQDGHEPEDCARCDGSGFHIAAMRGMIGLKQFPVKIVNANTVVVGAPIPKCPCECHEQ